MLVSLMLIRQVRVIWEARTSVRSSPSRMACRVFPDGWLTWESPAHCGRWCHPWAGGPRWYKKAIWALTGLCISSYLQIPALPESCPDFLLWWAVIWECKKNKLFPSQVADSMVFYHSNKNLNQNRNWYQRVNHYCDRPEHVFGGGYGRTLGWKRLKDESSNEHCGRKSLTGRLQTRGYLGIRGNGQRNTTEHWSFQ